MDAVRYKRHPVPHEVTDLELMDLYHCGPWDLERIDMTQAMRHLMISNMLAKINRIGQ